MAGVPPVNYVSHFLIPVVQILDSMSNIVLSVEQTNKVNRFSYMGICILPSVHIRDKMSPLI